MVLRQIGGCHAQETAMPMQISPLTITPGAPAGDAEARIARLEAQVAALTEALTSTAFETRLSSLGRLFLSGASIELNAGMIQTPGVIRCGTLIATNVVGTNYTPGAGNIW
jgi:hypothetical protein